MEFHTGRNRSAGDNAKLHADLCNNLKLPVFSPFGTFLLWNFPTTGNLPTLNLVFCLDTLLLSRAEVRDALKATGPEVKGQGSPRTWRMQPAQDQPLALTTLRPLCPTNGKEEEVNTGEEAELAVEATSELSLGVLRSKVA